MKKFMKQFANGSHQDYPAFSCPEDLRDYFFGYENITKNLGVIVWLYAIGAYPETREIRQAEEQFFMALSRAILANYPELKAGSE